MVKVPTNKSKIALKPPINNDVSTITSLKIVDDLNKMKFK